MACPDANTMARWFDGRMSSATLLATRAHLDECEACRVLLAEISREVVPERAEALAGEVTSAPVVLGLAIDRYRVVEWLGQGGMGVVYAAFDPQLERRVAIKLLRPSADDDERARTSAAERLLAEAKALARISHPHVVTVHDAGAHRGQVFLVMEYLRGTLGEWCERTAPSAAAIVERYAEAALGLAAAHEAGFVHGDVKPSNLMLGSDGRVRVTDFGLARETGGVAEENEPVAAGTPAYLAPEQLRGKKADARSDQYSFCVALREALEPFGDGGRVPPHVTRALARGLSSEPADRFGDMRQVLAALRPPLRRLAVPILLATAALLVAVAAVVMVQQARSARSRQELCAGAAAQWDGIWGGPERERAAGAFARSGAPYAADTWREAERETSDYVSRWAREYTEACTATRVRGEQSELRMNERMACLGDARDAARVVTAMFAAPSAAVVEDPVRELATLPDPQACDRPPPIGAGGEGRAAELEVKRALDQATAEDAAGEYAAAATREEALAEPATRTRDPRLQAEVAYAHGVTLANLNDGPRSVDELYRAVAFAEQARDDALKARTLVYLGFALSAKLSRPDEASHVAELAAAVVERTPGEVVTHARALQLASFIADGRGRYAEATAASERSVALLEAAYGPDDFRLSVPLENLGRALQYEGKMSEARDRIVRAAAILASTVGARHPLYAKAQYSLALLAMGTNDPAGALAAAQRALAAYQASRPDSVDRAAVEEILVQLLLDKGSFAQALEHAELAARSTASLPLRDDVRATALEQEGEALVKLGRHDEAIALDEQVVNACPREACDLNVEANGSFALGVALEAASRPAEAVAPLERVVALRTKDDGWPAKAAEAQFALGRVLQTSKLDAKRARALLDQALTTFRAHPEDEGDARRVESWLAAHPG